MNRRLFFSLMSILLISGILSSAFTAIASAGPITVDSASDSDDGVCGPPPEDCTLREAINDVNAGVGKKIDFDPVVFPPGILTTIILNSELPAIVESGTTIDGSGAGVEIHGAGLSGDGIIFESGAGVALTKVTVRSIIVRYFQGNGILICGGSRSANCNDPVSKVTISHVTVNGNDENGIFIRGSDIDRATVRHAYSEGNDSVGIRLYTPTGDINKLQISDCTTVDNNTGIFIHSENVLKAKLTDNTICRNSPAGGIDLNANSQLIHPKITGNTVSDNSRGISLSADDMMLKPNVSDNYVAYNPTGGIFASASSSSAQVSGGQFKDNVVMQNNQGIFIFSSHSSSTNVVNVKVQGNRIVNNFSSGIWIEGSKNQVKNNIVSDNGNHGIRLDAPGQGNKIQGNQVIGNLWRGISVGLNSTNAKIKGNEARGNDGNDLFDENGGCDSNTWRSNTFVTRNHSCIE